MNDSFMTQQQGLTLIEVLVSLAIIAIAMTAAIKATSMSVRGIEYLQEKTIALWVADQVINEARVEITKIPREAPLQQVTHMLNKDWYWELSQRNTPNPHIKEILVQVYADENEKDEKNPLVELTSFIYFNPENRSTPNEIKRP